MHASQSGLRGSRHGDRSSGRCRWTRNGSSVAATARAPYETTLGRRHLNRNRAHRDESFYHATARFFPSGQGADRLAA
jgi:hypothetical protein